MRVTGKYSHNAICDVCGFQFKNTELRKRWDGVMVCEKDYETRHIADFYKARNDSHVLPFTRPDTSDQTVHLKLGTESVTGGGTWTVTTNHAISQTPGADWQANSGQSLSVLAWVRLNTNALTNQAIISNAGSSGNGTWRLTVGGTGTQQLGTGLQPTMGVMAATKIAGSIQIQVASIDNVLQLNKWHHVAWVRDGVAQSDVIYVDGIPVTILTNTYGAVDAAADTVFLGRGGAATQAANISLADVRVFSNVSSSAALTMHQVRWNMANTAPTLPEPSTYLRAWWKLDDNSTTALADSSANGNNFTITTATDVSWVNKGIY